MELAGALIMSGEAEHGEALLRATLEELAADAKRLGSAEVHLHDVFGLRALLELNLDQAQPALDWVDRALAAANPEQPGFEEFEAGLATIRGGAYRRLGRYDEAERAYRDALAAYERLLGPDHDVVATQYSNLATVFERRGDSLQAIESLERALQIRIEMGLEAHPITADLRDNIDRLID